MHPALEMHYILGEDGEPIAVDLLTWAVWLEQHRGERILLQTVVDRRGDAHERPIHRGGRGVWISTVFLGLDHRFAGAGPPVLWETMIFGGALDQRYQERYTSKLAALQGHAAAVALVQALGQRLPRRLKDAIRTRDDWDRRLGPRARRRLARFDARVAHLREHLDV